MCFNGVALAQHSEATLTPREIRMLECVCVCDEWDHYSLSRKKMALHTPYTRASGTVILGEFKLTHTEATLAVVGGLCGQPWVAHVLATTLLYGDMTNVFAEIIENMHVPPE